MVGSMGLMSTLDDRTVVLLFAAFQFYTIRRLLREGAVCELK